MTPVPSWSEREGARVKRTDVERPGTRLQMRLVNDDGEVLATADEPFELGRFDLAAARQGMRKMLAGLGGIGDQEPRS